MTGMDQDPSALRAALWKALQAKARKLQRDEVLGARTPIVEFAGRDTEQWVYDVHLELFGAPIRGGAEIARMNMLWRPAIEEAVWDLVSARVLRPPAQPKSGRGEFFLTLHGWSCLTRDDAVGWTPLDPTGAVAKLRETFPDAPDLDVIAAYYGQAIEAWLGNLDLAAAVMVGCAYEIALYQLGAAVAHDLTRTGRVPESAKLKNAVRKLVEGEDVVSAYDIEQVLSSELPKCADRHAFPVALVEWIKGSMLPSFHVVRRHRNSAGHPTTGQVDHNETFAYTALFVPTYKRVREVCSILE